jgi:hypothetical protein
VEVIMNRCASLVFALALIAVPALANIPFPDLCVLNNPAGSDGAVLFVTPDGGGEPFTNARLAGGVPVDATLTLTVVNSEGDPIANYPASDIWLVTTGGGLVTCSLAHPGSATDANGQTQWIDTLFAGGNSLGEEAQAIIGNQAVPNTAAVQFVSPDISGDLAVNLTDITVFTQAIGVYNPVADFNNDGVVNLTDITLMAQSIGAGCP